MNRFFYIPEVASAQGPAIDRINDLVHWLMLALFVGWSLFFLFILVRFRASRNPRADYSGVKSHATTFLEGAVAVVEAILLIGFSIPLWAARVEQVPPPEESVVLRAIGEQFAWNFHYPGKDGSFGRTDVTLIDLSGGNPLGLDRKDPAAADDIVTINQLHLPVDKPAVIHLGTKDVIHSFNLPHMRVKQDAIPGMSIPVWFTPTITTDAMRTKLVDDDFVYEIACAQLCGLGHYRMRGFLTVHTPEAFNTWIEEESAKLEQEGEGGFWN